MTPSEILMKHEDANEYHFHEVDRKWIIEAMEEYAGVYTLNNLPTDEEIEEQSWGYREVTKDMEIPPNEDWSNGAKWMRDKIQGGNK